MNLLIEYHKSEDVTRHQEFLTCLEKNVTNSLFEKIFVFIVDGSTPEVSSKKIEIIRTTDRPQFQDLFRFCNKALSNEICVIACADIIFDDSLAIVNEIDFNKVFLALTRWESKDVPPIKATSQDVWIFKSPITVSEELLSQMNFTPGGYWGCDNKITYLLDQAGYELRNPGLQIKTLHHHFSTFRSRASSKRLVGPFLCLTPLDNIQDKAEYTRIKDFAEDGNPIL